MLRLGGNMMKLRLECLSALAVFGGFPVGNQRIHSLLLHPTFFKQEKTCCCWLDLLFISVYSVYLAVYCCLFMPLSSLDPRFYLASKCWVTMTMRRALQAMVGRRAVVGKQGNMVQGDNQQVFLCRSL